jgi:hypothetical protein
VRRDVRLKFRLYPHSTPAEIAVMDERAVRAFPEKDKARSRTGTE